jgi:hypothetical protein
MAPWIAHLRIAEALTPLGATDKTAFAYGSLAPDSGIPNADWTAFDPPKEVTHFLRRGEGEDKIRDIEFYQAYVVTAPHFEDDLAGHSFRHGYFFHLVVDNLWSRRINAVYKKRYPELTNNPTSPMWQTLKRDWIDLDFCYLRDNPEFSFWQIIMTTPNPPPYLPFLSPEGLAHSLDHIRTFYSTPNPQRNLNHPYIYLNEAAMNRFVKDCTRTLIKMYFRVVSQTRPPLDGLTSFLSLSDTADLAPYEMPLGDPS